ncbi:hypothetical protein L6452_35436 [Arctium lappa]|uniref:Uncharacterized protein n=1 Tax=Arctium lappa TaxID=4217 RepID=A0ACB8YAM0_ARCLA|nr:hypothetical protein L6452_35436 [Arctium lappa]
MVQRSLPLVPTNSLDNNFSRKIREFTEQLAINEVRNLTRGLEESNINNFVEEVLMNGEPWALGTSDVSHICGVVTGSHVFVCAHNCRDKRYGYVTLDDVPELLDQHIKKSKGFGGTIFPSYPLFSIGC